MADTPNYPKFVWVVVAAILVAIVGYALLSQQPVEELQFPGGGVKFGTKPKEEAVKFPVSYEIGGPAIEGHATLFVAGGEPIVFTVDQTKPSHTANITVPRPGTYSYRLEQWQVLKGRGARTGRDVVFRKTWTGDGKIDVQPGIAFKIQAIINTGQTVLESVRSAEERKASDEEFVKELIEEYDKDTSR